MMSGAKASEYDASELFQYNTFEFSKECLEGGNILNIL